MEKIRIMIIDDHPVVRKGLNSLLSQYTDIEIVGESDGGQDVVEKVNKVQPDIALLDIRLSERNGLRLASQFKQTHPQMRIIILTSYEDKDYLLDAIKAGARAYILKSASAEFLIQVIRDVFSGKMCLSEQMIGVALESLDAANKASMKLQSDISEDELTLLKLLADGATSRDISQTLYISERSAKRRIEHILEKLDVTNRAQAVAEGYKRGLL